MKNLSSNIEGVWKDKLKFTEEQIEVLKTGTKEEKKAVIEESNVEASTEDTALANTIYNTHKPTDENYQLIACNITIDGEIGRGIINFRVAGQHKQIRF